MKQFMRMPCTGHNIVAYTLRKKGTKAITGAVLFQKVKLLSILRTNMSILAANMGI